MDNRPNFIKRAVKKHTKKFSLFMVVGIIKTILSILLTGLFIDILKLDALFSSTAVVVIVFFITYMIYVSTKLVKPQFMKYTSATIGFNIATILLIWILVDYVGLSGFISSAIVTITSFVLRYLFFNIIGLIRHG